MELFAEPAVPSYGLLPHAVPAVPAVFDTVDLFLPDVQFETEAAYIRLPHTVRQRLKEAGEWLHVRLCEWLPGSCGRSGSS
jgi:hypothetical protein